MGLSPLPIWDFHHCPDGTLTTAQMGLSPLPRWDFHPCPDGTFTTAQIWFSPLPRWDFHHCPDWTFTTALMGLSTLPKLDFHPCPDGTPAQMGHPCPQVSYNCCVSGLQRQCLARTDNSATDWWDLYTSKHSSTSKVQLFYWPKLLYPYYSLLLLFSFSSFCL